MERTTPFVRGQQLLACIEVCRGSRIKRDGRGRIDFISPLPSPFDYGSLVDAVRAPDGEGYDVLVLGPTRRRGERVTLPLLGIVDFVDAGVPDAKLVLGERFAPDDGLRIDRFFWRYAQIKRLMRPHRESRYCGWLMAP